MCMADVPDPPQPEKAPVTAGRDLEGDRKKRAMGFARTILTGAKGVQGAAPTAGKVLLGG